MASVPEQIFKAYDVRGLYGDEIDADTAEQVGRAFVRVLSDLSELRREARFFLPARENFRSFLANPQSQSTPRLLLRLTPRRSLFFACISPAPLRKSSRTLVSQRGVARWFGSA